MAISSVDELNSPSKISAFVKSILSKTSRNTKLINHLLRVIQYKDVLFYTWKTLMKALQQKNENCDIFMLNTLELLENISISRVMGKGEPEACEGPVLGFHKGPEKFVLDLKLLKKYERKVWQLLINKEMSPKVHKRLLLVLLEFYLSKLENPIFLTDFFWSSLNKKGVFPIMALQGIATLMQKHNIEYPNVYGKLYTLFEPSIFHTKFKSRLFYLANIFLSSTHLPENLVASFAKRASRLSLRCSTPDILIIIRFIENLLIRHTGLIKMIHHPEAVEVSEDPFLEGENDPMKTRALESSLWEISLMCNLCQPSVASAANFIHAKLPSMEFDLSQVLEHSYEKIFESELKKTKKIKPSLTFHRPKETVARLKDDQVFKIWSLTD